MPERTIQVRFQRSQPTRRVVVYYKGQRLGEARLLDAVANDRKPSFRGPDPDTAAGAIAVAPQGPPPAPAPATVYENSPTH